MSLHRKIGKRTVRTAQQRLDAIIEQGWPEMKRAVLALSRKLDEAEVGVPTPMRVVELIQKLRRERDIFMRRAAVMEQALVELGHLDVAERLVAEALEDVPAPEPIEPIGDAV